MCVDSQSELTLAARAHMFTGDIPPVQLLLLENPGGFRGADCFSYDILFAANANKVAHCTYTHNSERDRYFSQIRRLIFDINVRGLHCAIHVTFVDPNLALRTSFSTTRQL